METGAVLELSVSASTASEAVVTTTMMALAHDDAAAVVSSTKTTQPEGSSSSSFPISAVEAEKGAEADAPFEARALNGAAVDCGRRETRHRHQ